MEKGKGIVNAVKRAFPQINKVIIYEGHKKNPFFGPYPENVGKRIQMFNLLNSYRERSWKVVPIGGEELIQVLKEEDPKETLLVIPAGQSTRLDKVFSVKDTHFLKEEFFSKGGRGYFNCGSAYWVSSKRIYKDLCEEAPEVRKPIVKTTNLSLFQGIAEGPLCPFPGKKYQVGFFSDAVDVEGEHGSCTIFLSGGGSFMVDESAQDQQVKVLVRYPHSELIRHGKKKEECAKWEKAAIMVKVDQGAVLLSMFHPYYGPKDIDAEAYERALPDCGTNWRDVQSRLSPLDVRMQFVMRSMLGKLEAMDFN